MEPGISAGADILGDRSHYAKSPPQRWDVVVFTLPGQAVEPGCEPARYVKRIVGLPGEMIQLGPSGLLINGSAPSVPAELKDRFSSFKTFPEYKYGIEPFAIPADSVFLMGDNSSVYVVDSRVLGPIPVRNLEARVWGQFDS
jgi:signal peptidase I